MIQFLALTVIGKYDPSLPERLTGAIAESGCNIRESRITILGQEFSMLLLLSGNWNAVVKVEDALNRLGQEVDLSINMRRTEMNKSQKNLMPYAIDVVCSDRIGVVNRITRFIQDNGIQIRDLSTTTYEASHTGTEMFSLHLTIHVPVEISISSLRNDFLEFCDQLNLDAIIEPVK